MSSVSIRRTGHSHTISDHDGSTSALSKCTVHQDGLALGQSPLDHIAHRFKYREKVFLGIVSLFDVDVRDPCLSIRFPSDAREVVMLD